MSDEEDVNNSSFPSCDDVEMDNQESLDLDEGNDFHSNMSIHEKSNELCEGMSFDNVDDAQACYKAYAIRKGFSIRTNHTRLSRPEKELIGVDYTCSKEGFRKEKTAKEKQKVKVSYAETRVGCKAMMSLRKDGVKWNVTKFVENHNHVLCSPRSSRLLPGNKRFTPAQRCLVDTLNEAGVPPRKIMSVLSEQCGGQSNIGCTPSNIQTYLGSKRRQLLKEGDVQRMYNYFKECQSKNPGFFYAIEVGEHDRMGNCFWADTRSRLAYQAFGGAVTFDATYLTNCYGMPFVPFTGVDHHFQTVMFGCALLVDETIESYVWLLKTWLEAMGGCAPKTILTDDDKSMRRAIIEVLPETTHHLCMWHILQKFPEHLAHVYNKYPLFKSELHHCIHNISLVEEFELEWHELTRKYELEENSWLKDLYARRERWVPAYIRSTFCAGMSTTQRSESMNKFFKGYVRSSTLVSDFVFQYEKALDSRYQKEKVKNVKTIDSKPVLKTCYQIEQEAAKVYTRKIFLKFQEELFSSQKYKAIKFFEDGGKKTYKVMPTEKERPVYNVMLHVGEGKSSCSCHMFEFCGILCKHILTVFVKKFLVSSLPVQYILKRWTMEAKLRSFEGVPAYALEETDSSLMLLRHHLIMNFLDVLELGNSKEKLSTLSRSIEKVREEYKLMDDTSKMGVEGGMVEVEKVNVDSNILSNPPCDQIPLSDTLKLQDPAYVISKGRPKSLRAKHPKETKRNKCGNCQQLGHNQRRCSLPKAKER